jgi:hypothetical protein
VSSINRVFVAGTGALALFSLACSDSSGPSKNLTYGTFSVSIPVYNSFVTAPCVVPSFQFTVDTNASGDTTLALPDSLAYGCVSILADIPLLFDSFTKAGDSLEIVWTDDALATPRTLVLRWKPGSNNLAGTATLQPTGASIPESQIWTGVRQ